MLDSDSKYASGGASVRGWRWQTLRRWYDTREPGEPLDCLPADRIDWLRATPFLLLHEVETYHLGADGAICTSFRFRDGGFQGPLKTIRSTATVVPGSGNAQWSVRLFWVLHAQYLVAWLAADYSRVIVARDARDYVWLMARTPQVSPGDYRDMLARVSALGYNLQRLRKVPQQWPDQRDSAPAAALARQCSS